MANSIKMTYSAAPSNGGHCCGHAHRTPEAASRCLNGFLKVVVCREDDVDQTFSGSDYVHSGHQVTPIDY